MVADYQAGLPTTTLTIKYGVANGTVLRILDDHGVARRHQPLTEEQAQHAIKLYQDGWSLAQVGEHLGRDGTVILLVLKRAGAETRPPGTRATDKLARGFARE